MDVHIVAELCKGCDLCRKNCPAGAISGEPGKVHVVDPSKCIKCGTCIAKCPFHAIKG